MGSNNQPQFLYLKQIEIFLKNTKRKQSSVCKFKPTLIIHLMWITLIPFCFQQG
jgi:hypothetical protein